MGRSFNIICLLTMCFSQPVLASQNGSNGDVTTASSGGASLYQAYDQKSEVASKSLCDDSADKISIEACDLAYQAASTACENPMAALGGGLADAKESGGLNTGNLLNSAGQLSPLATMALGGGDPVRQCNAAKQLANSSRLAYGGFAAACSSAAAALSLACSNAVSRIKDAANKTPGLGAEDCFTEKLKQANLGKRRADSFLVSASQAFSQAANAQAQYSAMGKCEDLASNAVPPECQASGAQDNPACTQYCFVPSYAAAHTFCSNVFGKNSQGLDCTLQANASNLVCKCKLNPTDPSCPMGGTNNLAGSKITDGFPDNSYLRNTAPPEYLGQGSLSASLGAATPGQAGSGGGQKPPSGGGGPGPQPKAAGGSSEKIDTNIDHGFKAAGGGASVSGVPVGSGGGGGSNVFTTALGERISLAALRPGGRGRDAFRSLAAQSEGSQGVICATCKDIFVKVTERYQQHQPTLNPQPSKL